MVYIQHTGRLDYNDCPPLSQYTGWPTWESVERARLEAGVDGDRGHAVNNCAAMSVLFQLTWTATDSFFFMITVDLMLNLITSPFGSTSKRWRFYHGWTWTISILLAVALYLTGDWGVSFDSVLEDFCWHKNFGRTDTAENSNRWLTGEGILGMNIVYGLSGFYNLAALLVSCYSYYKLNSLTEGQRQVRAATIKEGIMVTLVCALWWMVLFGFVYHSVLSHTQEIVENTQMHKAPTDYQTGDRFWVVIWAFVVGGRNIVTPLVWQLVVWKVHGEHGDSADAGGGGGGKDLNQILQDELLFFTGLGIRHVVRDSAPRGYTRDSVSIEQRDDKLEIDLEVAANWELQNESVFYKSFQRVFLKGREDIDGFPDTLKEQMQNFKFKSYRPQKFAQLRRLFAQEDRTATAPPSPQGQRQGQAAAAAGASADQIDDVLHSAMDHYEAGDFSGGASGAFMYFSNDKRYIVKQMTEEEKDVLLEMLDEYYLHMRANPDSLLLRVVQCNQVQMYQACSKVPLLKKCMKGRLWFMVFENLNFNALQDTMEELRMADLRTSGGLRMRTSSAADVADDGAGTDSESESELRARAGKALKESMLQYDLKGSWVNRTTITKGPPAQSGAVGTLKDGDLHEQIYLQKEERNALIEQLRKDTEFLSKATGRGIMDYSLLLGIKRR